jgi:outer membrane protein assembly factor BamA
MKLSARTVIAAVAVGLLTSRAAAQKDRPPKPPLIRSVVVRGTLGITAETVASISMLSPGQRATPGALETGRMLLVESISGGPDQDKWLQTSLTVRAEPVPDDPGRVDVVFEVPYGGPSRRFGWRGGPRGVRIVMPVIAGLNITGSGPIPPKEVAAQIRTKPGDAADFDAILADMRAIEKYYDSKGYIARVIGQGFRVRNGVLEVPIAVSKLIRIRFSGLRTVPDDTVRKYLTQKPGDYYNGIKFKRDYATLLKTGLFEDVQPILVDLGPESLELLLKFVERQPGHAGAKPLNLDAPLVPTLVAANLPNAAAQKDKPVDAPRIAAIEIRGNKALNRDAIVAMSGLKIGDGASAKALDAARQRLLSTGMYGMYRDNPEDAVKFSIVTRNAAAHECKLVISIEENPVVKGFHISGNGPIASDEVMAEIHSRPGAVVNVHTLRADIDRIQKLYDRKGYIANVTEEGFGIGFGRKRGIIAFPIVVGKISQIRLLGLNVVPAETVQNHMKLKVGDYYNINAFKNDFTAMYNTNLFAEIQPAILTPKAGEVALTLHFVEKPK